MSRFCRNHGRYHEDYERGCYLQQQAEERESQMPIPYGEYGETVIGTSGDDDYDVYSGYNISGEPNGYCPVPGLVNTKTE